MRWNVLESLGEQINKDLTRRLFTYASTCLVFEFRLLSHSTGKKNDTYVIGRLTRRCYFSLIKDGDAFNDSELALEK